MYAVRRWATRNAGLLERLYRVFRFHIPRFRSFVVQYWLAAVGKAVRRHRGMDQGHTF